MASHPVPTTQRSGPGGSWDPALAQSRPSYCRHWRSNQAQKGISVCPCLFCQTKQNKKTFLKSARGWYHAQKHHLQHQHPTGPEFESQLFHSRSSSWLKRLWQCGRQPKNRGPCFTWKTVNPNKHFFWKVGKLLPYILLSCWRGHLQFA